MTISETFLAPPVFRYRIINQLQVCYMVYFRDGQKKTEFARKNTRKMRSDDTICSRSHRCMIICTFFCTLLFFLIVSKMKCNVSLYNQTRIGEIIDDLWLSFVRSIPNFHSLDQEPSRTEKFSFGIHLDFISFAKWVIAEKKIFFFYYSGSFFVLKLIVNVFHYVAG